MAPLDAPSSGAFLVSSPRCSPMLYGPLLDGSGGLSYVEARGLPLLLLKLPLLGIARVAGLAHAFIHNARQGTWWSLLSNLVAGHAGYSPTLESLTCLALGEDTLETSSSPLHHLDSEPQGWL